MSEAPNPVTVIGLGAMGSALAAALARAGYDVTVWNRTPGRASGLDGVREAATAGQAVAAAELVLVCVLDYDAVRSALADADLTGRTLVNLTNGSPLQARQTALWAGERGAAGYVDGGIMAVPPMIGQPGSLILYSGSEAGFDRHRSALGVLGEARWFGTDPGQAALYDIALLTGMYGTFIGFLQSVALVRSAGGKAEEFMELLGPWLQAMSGALPRAARAVDSGDHTRDVASNLAMQTAAFANLTRTAQEQGVSAELLLPLRALMERGVADGRGAEDLFSVIELMGGAA